MCSLYTADLERLVVTAEASAGSSATIHWSHLVDEVCPCVNYTIRRNGMDQPDDVPCDQNSVVIGSESLDCGINNVSVIPRSAHPNIGLLENLSGYVIFNYTSFGKLIHSSSIFNLRCTHARGLL